MAPVIETEPFEMEEETENREDCQGYFESKSCNWMNLEVDKILV